MKSDKKYWENYYKTFDVLQPSHFAEYVLENFCDDKKSMIELGCGNGRDACFFANNNMSILAIDQCSEAINILNKNNKLSNLEFLVGDFTKLSDFRKFDLVYSRFTLHSISRKQEDNVIAWAQRNLFSKGRFCIEARGFKNSLYEKGSAVLDEPNAFIFDNHFRRFINLQDLKNKLLEHEFKIIYAKEDTGFAPFKDTDDYYIRVIAERE